MAGTVHRPGAAAASAAGYIGWCYIIIVQSSMMAQPDATALLEANSAGHCL